MSATSRLKDWIHDQKDSSVSFVAEKMIEKRLERYGRLMELKLNSRQHTLDLKLLLRGETEPVALEIHEYELTEDQGHTYVTVKRASASRQWLTLVLEDFLIGARIEIPEKYAGYTRLLL